MLYNLFYVILWPIFNLLFHFEVQGLEFVPEKGGLILCCNHISFLDPPIVGLAMQKRPVWFMARSTLFKNFFFGTLIRFLHAFPVKRNAIDRHVWKVFEDLIRKERAILVFPEGTRSPDGTPHEGKAGTGMLIYRSPGATVIPIRIRGSENVLPRGAKWIRLSKIRLSFGSPIILSKEMNLPAERKTYEMITGKVMGAIAEL